MEELFKIAGLVSTPLALGGLFAVVFSYILKRVLTKTFLTQATSSEHSADIIRRIIDRTFVLSLVAMILGFAAFVIPSFLGATPAPAAQPAPCRDKSHGVERYQREFDVAEKSHWMGGGYSQDPWCTDLIGKLRGQHPEARFAVLEKSEESKSTCLPLNCPQYQYYCKVRVSTDPLYFEKQTSACK